MWEKLICKRQLGVLFVGRGQVQGTLKMSEIERLLDRACVFSVSQANLLLYFHFPSLILDTSYSISFLLFRIGTYSNVPIMKDRCTYIQCAILFLYYTVMLSWCLILPQNNAFAISMFCVRLVCFSNVYYSKCTFTVFTDSFPSDRHQEGL